MFHGTQEYGRLKVQEEQEDYDKALAKARIEDDLRRRENSQVTLRVETGQLPSNLDDMRAYSDLTGKTGVIGITRYRSRSVNSQDSSRLFSPPPTTQFGGSDIYFPLKTQSMKYEGSIAAFPPSALPQDPFSTLRVSAGIIARRYIQSEENASQHAAKEEGMQETWKVYTPIPRKFEISDSEDDALREVKWREVEPYMIPTKKGKKCNKRKGVKRPETLERPIPNMRQTPSRRKLEVDWAKPAEGAANGKRPGNLKEFIGEYPRNTNGLREFMLAKENYNNSYAEWCGKQAEHLAARQNHTDAGVTNIRKCLDWILTKIELSREYDEERWDKLDQRLEKIEKKVAKVAPVNMAKTIENALSGCMEMMIDQLMDRVVKRFENATEEDRKKGEIQRGKQVEATPEKEMSNIEFELGATFSREENE